MTTDQLRNVILEAVDCLRQRKCRPDRESIAVYVMRKLGSSMTEIFSEIENIVDQGLLLKVEYKGSTSYRSPKSFDVKNSPLLTKHSKILNSSKTTRYVISGINELLSSFPNYNQEGVPYEDLKKKLVEFDRARFAESGIKVIFEREEGAGNILVAQSEDPILPVRIFPKDIEVPANMKVISFTEDTNPSTERKKRKRPKKEEVESEKVDVIVKGPCIGEDKETVVYAVKSDPHKFIQNDSLEEDQTTKVKAEQISTIGLKVVAGKIRNAPKPSSGGNKRNCAVSSQSSEPNSEETFEKKPCLALLNHDTATNSKIGCLTAANGSAGENKSLDDEPIDSTTNAIMSKLVEEKTLDVQPSKVPPRNSRSAKGKKLKKKTDVLSENESDDQITFSQAPPRYTYASKKRGYGMTAGNSSNSYKRKVKTMKRDATESENSLDDAVLNNQNGETCAYCRTEVNGEGDNEDFLFCGSCNAKIHPTCIDYSKEQAERLRLNSNSDESHLRWQCFSCKRCGECQKALMPTTNGPEIKSKAEGKGKLSRKKEQRYILCDQCDRGYHVQCISGTPPTSDSSWFCGECQAKDVNKDANTINEGKASVQASRKKRVPVTKRKGRQAIIRNQSNTSALSSIESDKDSISSPVEKVATDVEDNDTVKGDPGEVPDISSWTPSQVQKYFTEKGLNDEAASLREQEIDGMSLLLLRRADVIFGLNLRLGPALKIYRLVCQLQQHSSALKKRNGNDGNSLSKRNETASC